MEYLDYRYPQKATIKAGTSVLIAINGDPVKEVMLNLMKEMVQFKRDRLQSALVSSGAVARGKKIHPLLGEGEPEIVRQQGWFALGHHKLMDDYDAILAHYKMHSWMGVLEKYHFGNETARHNIIRPLEVAMRDPVTIPILNENDLAAVNELPQEIPEEKRKRFTDNDELAKDVTLLINGDTAVFLTGSVDGVMDTNGHVIPELRLDDLSKEEQISFEGFGAAGLDLQGKNPDGRGGMALKLKSIFELSRQGKQVFIAKGIRENVVHRLFDMDRKMPFTYIAPMAPQI